jgi:hypothetical protein
MHELSIDGFPSTLLFPVQSNFRVADVPSDKSRIPIKLLLEADNRASELKS